MDIKMFEKMFEDLIKPKLDKISNEAYCRGAEMTLNIIVQELEKGVELSQILIALRMTILETKEEFKQEYKDKQSGGSK